MKSAKCTNCGFVGWADAEFCKRCGTAMFAPVAGELAPASDGFTPSYSSYPSYAVAPGAELKKGLAVTSLVLGILNFLLFGILVVPVVVGIIMSVVALNKVSRYPHEYGGKGLAIGGLVTNIVTAVCLVPVLIILSIALPNLLAARMAANEGGALHALRTIHSAETTYQATAGKGRYGTLNDLQNSQLISSDLATGVKWGYRFKVEVNDSERAAASFALVAVPTEYRSSGRRSFFVDESGVIRGEDLHGLEANRNTPPVDFSQDYPPERRLDTRRTSSYTGD